MTTDTTIPSNTKRLIRLKTQKQRATFVRREIRVQGMTVNSVAEEAVLDDGRSLRTRDHSPAASGDRDTDLQRPWIRRGLHGEEALQGLD